MIAPKILAAWKASTALAAAIGEAHQDAVQDGQDALTEAQCDDLETKFDALEAARQSLMDGG